MVRTEKKCRVCDGSLVDLLDFGEIYPSGFVKSQEGLTKAPLVLAGCDRCGMVQLKHTVDLDLMYKEQYWYSSALNKSMVSSLENVADEAMKRQPLEEGDIVIDIGCNDGTLFDFFPEDVYKIGFDPAQNMKESAEARCNEFINDYFNSDLLPIGTHGNAKIITSIAMFYDLPRPHDFIGNVVQALAHGGVWVIQFTDLLSMLQLNAFDNICHEHLEYYRLIDLVNIFREHNLEIFDLEYNSVNGGSLRVYVSHKSARETAPIVHQMLEYERTYFTSLKDPFAAFQKRIKIAELGLKQFLETNKEAGKRTFLLGASTKGNTLLQIWGLTNEDFEYALEVNPDKFGLRTVGSDIPIISEEEGMAKDPDNLLLLPWHFSNSIIPKLESFMDGNGMLLLPLPSFTLNYREDGFLWTLEQKVTVS
jgi:trans-aconitate methyltransferase